MRVFRISMLFGLALASQAAAQMPATGGAASITPTDVQKRIQFLASDELKGRDTPSPGLEKAAEYIAREFASFGLKPAGDAVKGPVHDLARKLWHTSPGSPG